MKHRPFHEATITDARNWLAVNDKFLWAEDWLWATVEGMPSDVEDRSRYIAPFEDHLESLLNCETVAADA